VYRRLWRGWDQFTDRGTFLLEKLRSMFSIEYPEVRQAFVSRDGTRRYLFDAGSGQRIEAVFIPEEKRDTLCVSTQVGCAMGCVFCASGRLRMQRNLSAGEIAGQVMALEADRGVQAKRLNIVIMGMGEPFNNYENVMTALRLMTCGEGMSISPRRITLSTAGIVPGIERLAREPVQPNLAISLNASSDAVRDRLMPVNLKWNIAALLDACRRFPLAERRRITFEYVLIGGVNDSYEDARRLVGLLGNLRHKVNLIPLNADPELGFKPPAPERVEAFAGTLADHYITAIVRRPRGDDIAAACGMLAARDECP
jgi:23S rRNA (adenine2503-C2)-methyltransferase